MTAWYNEIDPFAAQWLRNLIATGHIAPGIVDERSIADVKPEDLREFTQCHFFAGVGVWSYALRRAGWSDDRRVWTGSCPCQPFSAAGKGGGFADERHLWPHFHWLISQCQPDVVLGEQVASKDGLGWIDLVQADLEGSGYASGAVDICAAGVGMDWEESRAGEWLRRAIRALPHGAVRSALLDFADFARGGIVDGVPHIRQRLYWFGKRVADDDDTGLEGRSQSGCERTGERASGSRGLASGLGEPDSSRSLAGIEGISPARQGCTVDAASRSIGLALPDGGYAGAEREQRSRQHGQQPEDSIFGGLADAGSGRREAALLNGGTVRSKGGEREADQLGGRGAPSGVANADEFGHNGSGTRSPGRDEPANRSNTCRTGAAYRERRDVDWLFCRDGKWRPVESGAFPLAHDAPARMGRLRGYGNAIVAETAIRFIETYVEAETEDAERLRLGVFS